MSDRPLAPDAAASRTTVTVKTVAALALLTTALPVNLAVTAIALARKAVRPAHPAAAPYPRTILISGGKMTKSLALCRAFHTAGHRVVLVETAKYRLTGHRFSNAVDAFYVVPAPTDPGYAAALLAIARSENVDLYVPVCSPVASHYDALAAETLAPYCAVLTAHVDTVDMLDDKFRFAGSAADAGLGTPDTKLVTSASEVERFPFADRAAPYVLKNIAYDPVNRLDLTPLPRPSTDETSQFARSKSMTVERPWILQSFVRGEEYCTHSTVHDGRIDVWACCRSSAFQLNYEFVDRPAILDWVTRYVAFYGLTGQVSFDFIIDDAGDVRAIECNPRTHSAITMFYDYGPELAAAYLGERGPGAAPLTPSTASRPTYWLYHELWRLLAHPAGFRERWRTVRHGRDAIFDVHDPLPFLLVHHLQIPLLLLGNLRHGRQWTRIDFNIGKLVEPGGD